jgi:hypothetical protein
MVPMQPLSVSTPVPEARSWPLQQKRYWPVRALNRTTLPGLESSCRQALNTVTVKLQVAVLPDVSVAVHVTVVVPTGKIEPEGGTQTKVTPGQLSVTTGGGKLTTVVVAMGQVAAAVVVTFEGQVMLGGCVSLTVTVNEQLAPAVVEQVTVVVPTGKNEPEAGKQVTVKQSPLVVGAG